MDKAMSSSLRRRVYDILESPGRGNGVGGLIDCALMVLIALNVVAVTLESVESIGVPHATLFRVFNTVSVLLFTLEYAARLWVCVELDPAAGGRALRSRLRYAVTPLAVIDLLAIAPFYLSALFGIDLRFLRVLRLLRILKLTRYSAAINLLMNVFRQEARAFGAALFILGIVLVFASAGIYLVEHAVQPEAFGSIPAAMWWAVATLTTVGYGDVTPITPWGKVFGACVTIVGIGMVALPSGLLASGFSNQLRKQRVEYEQELHHALADGLIDEQEARQLERLRQALDLSAKEAAALRRQAARQPQHPHLRHCPHCGRQLGEPPPEHPHPA